MKKYLLFITFILQTSTSIAQDLLCNVRVNASQVQTSDRKVFQTLQTDIYEFINDRKWTSVNIGSEEKIECNIMINISKKISNDQYEASIQVQSTRPIYGTSYKSTLFNHLDNDFNFKYIEFQSLEFSESSFSTNLSSVLAFYINIIIGLDFATFSEDNAYEYFNKAQKIVNNAQNSSERGWKAFENDKNRYWLINDLMDQRYSVFHSCLYKYHRHGLDKLSEDPEDARFEITESIESLKSIYRQNSSSNILRLFFDAKSDEISNIFSESFPNEQARIIKTLVELDPLRSNKYQSIVKAQNRGE